MRTHNDLNERIKREYFIYLKDAKGYSESSLDGVAKALDRFEVYNRHRDFKAFHIKQAMGFKQHLAAQKNVRTKVPLSKATLNSTLTALKNFFVWLAGRPGYRSRIAYSDGEYFNLSEKDARVARARRDQRVPTLKQINHVIASMPTATLIERRNRAIIAFTILTGARDGALASLKLKHVSLADGHVYQDARQVKTKFSKTFKTWFFPVGEETLQIVIDWIDELRTDQLWGDEDPLFPATQVAQGETRQFEAVGLHRKHWGSGAAIREIFKDAFARADIPYANPHSFRNTLAQLGERMCKTPEAFKAWSQNLGHESVLTTLMSYGEVAPARQTEIIRDLGAVQASTEHIPSELLQKLRELLSPGAVGR